ncbi:hypothetical protein MKX07_001096 [Trichoderma sp. CBMAI-0711]|nr:hypothetical protein MKX07_001096 [Trichoderma sp. CBMAI-0711]
MAGHLDVDFCRPPPPPPRLVEQQGEIQPAPATLLGDRHVSHRGLNLPKGLAMLRHKLRVL